MRGTVWLSI
ncbi:hypothetical protein D047_0135A, partial [Vibrio parahaemolyticus VPTS-2010_2]